MPALSPLTLLDDGRRGSVHSLGYRFPRWATILSRQLSLSWLGELCVDSRPPMKLNEAGTAQTNPLPPPPMRSLRREAAVVGKSFAKSSRH